jgi:hypothetical protein
MFPAGNFLKDDVGIATEIITISREAAAAQGFPPPASSLVALKLQISL